MHNIFNKIREKATSDETKEKISSIKYDIEDAALTVKARTERFAYDVRSHVFYIKNEYKNTDAWNFGDFLINRAAENCGFLAAQSYQNVRCEWVADLKNMENIFSGYKTLNEIYLTIMVNDLRTQDNDFRAEAVEDHDKFMETWMNYYDNVLTQDISHYFMDWSDDSGMLRRLSALARTIDDRTHMRRNMNREMFGTDWILDEFELICKLLGKYISNIHSYPDDYINTAHPLYEKDEKWKKRSAIAQAFLIKDGFKSYVVSEGEDKCRIKKHEEIEESFAAWTSDLACAEDSLRLYIDWNRPIDDSISRSSLDDETDSGMSVKQYMELYNPIRAKELDSEINSMARKVWEWFGYHIDELWD